MNDDEPTVTVACVDPLPVPSDSITNSVTHPTDNGRPTFASVPIVAPPEPTPTHRDRPPRGSTAPEQPPAPTQLRPCHPRRPDAEPRRIARSSIVRRSSTSDPTAIVTHSLTVIIG